MQRPLAEGGDRRSNLHALIRRAFHRVWSGRRQDGVADVAPAQDPQRAAAPTDAADRTRALAAVEQGELAKGIPSRKAPPLGALLFDRLTPTATPRLDGVPKALLKPSRLDDKDVVTLLCLSHDDVTVGDAQLDDTSANTGELTIRKCAPEQHVASQCLHQSTRRSGHGCWGKRWDSVHR